MARKYIINPEKYYYDPKLLKEYQKLFKIISDYCKNMPDRFWSYDDYETLKDKNLVPRLIELAKELTKTRVKK